MCQALDKSAVESAFGSSVSFGRSSSSGCQIEAQDGRSMIVAVFDYLKLSEYKKPDTTDITVAGHPAVKTPTTIIYVARSTNPTPPASSPPTTPVCATAVTPSPPRSSSR